MRSDRLRLQDILDAIDVIEQYLPTDRADFDRDSTASISHLPARHDGRRSGVAIVAAAQGSQPARALEADRGHAAHYGTRLFQGGLEHRLHHRENERAGLKDPGPGDAVLAANRNTLMHRCTLRAQNFSRSDLMSQFPGRVLVTVMLVLPLLMFLGGCQHEVLPTTGPHP